MTPKLENGALATNASGCVVMLSGAEAMLQQVVFLLSIKKGSFAPNPELGSELLNADLNQCSEEYLFQLVADSLLQIPQVTVTSVKRTTSEKHKLILTLNLVLQQQEYTIQFPL